MRLREIHRKVNSKRFRIRSIKDNSDYIVMETTGDGGWFHCLKLDMHLQKMEFDGSAKFALLSTKEEIEWLSNISQQELYVALRESYS